MSSNRRIAGLYHQLQQTNGITAGEFHVVRHVGRRFGRLDKTNAIDNTARHFLLQVELAQTADAAGATVQNPGEGVAEIAEVGRGSVALQEAALARRVGGVEKEAAFDVGGALPARGRRWAEPVAEDAGAVGAGGVATGLRV